MIRKSLVKVKNQRSDSASHLPWVLDVESRVWSLNLVAGMIEILVWDGRSRSLIWPWFNGFRCQIVGEKTIDIEFPGVSDAEEAKQLAAQKTIFFVHQVGSELGLWKKKIKMTVTEPVVLFEGKSNP